MGGMSFLYDKIIFCSNGASVHLQTALNYGQPDSDSQAQKGNANEKRLTVMYRSGIFRGGNAGNGLELPGEIVDGIIAQFFGNAGKVPLASADKLLGGIDFH